MNYFVHGITKTGGKPHARGLGEYWNFDEAVTAAKQHIDDFLYREYQRAVWHGVTPTKLLTLYKRAGEAMLILPKINCATYVPHFDHLEYAKNKCEEICVNSATPPKVCSAKA